MRALQLDLLAPLLAAALAAAPAAAQDLSVTEIGMYQGVDDYKLHGIDQGIAAYSLATTACNVGSLPVQWEGASGLAPILATNAYRIVDGRIEQIGYNFIKYGGCSVDNDAAHCPGSCLVTAGCSLGVSCADVYWATLNDGKFGGGRWELDPVTGAWPAGTPTPPTGNPTIRGRLQIELTDFADPGALYFVEGQYIGQDDHAAGHARNDYGWREVAVDGTTYQITNADITIPGQPAIYAWQAYTNDVLIDETPVVDEGGPGVHGWVFVGSRAIDLGGGTWRYEYAVQNGNSDRGVGTFALGIPCDGTFALSSPTYRGVRHHSGSPYSNAAWTFSQGADFALWRTTPYSNDPAASAIRWGELARFGFTCNRPPVSGVATLGLFKPGTPTELTADVVVPSGEFPAYCTANANSTGQAAVLAATGSSHVTDASLRLDVTSLPPNVFGYFLMSQTTTFVPLFGGSQGNLCVGAPQVRFSQDVLHSGAAGEVSFDVDFGGLPQNIVFQAGDVWHFQYWYRDVNPTQTSNTSQGVTVTFCP